jgi:hypothetical protein
MTQHPALRCLLIGPITLALLAPLGCKSIDTAAAGSGSGADLSGPPVFNAKFQTREPRKCSQVKSPPSVGQAAALIQCQREQMNAHEDWITTNVQVEMAAQRAFIYETDSGLPEIDTASKVIPLRGSLNGYICAVIGEVNGVQGKNCMRGVVAEAKGACWKTTFGDWKCNEDGVINPTTFGEPPPPPVY